MTGIAIHPFSDSDQLEYVSPLQLCSVGAWMRFSSESILQQESAFYVMISIHNPKSWPTRNEHNAKAFFLFTKYIPI